MPLVHLPLPLVHLPLPHTRPCTSTNNPARTCPCTNTIDRPCATLFPQVGILECDAAGTRFYLLRHYEREWHKMYEEIALRPLLWAGRGSAEACKTLQKWYEEVVGTPYHLTISKLFAGQQVNGHNIH